MNASFDMYLASNDPPEVELGPIIGFIELTGAAGVDETIGVTCTELGSKTCPVL